MNSERIQNKADAVKPMDVKRTISFQLNDDIIENRENIENATENLKSSEKDLKQNRTNVNKVNSKLLIYGNQELTNDALTLKNKTNPSSSNTCDELKRCKVEPISKDEVKISSKDTHSILSEIYISCRFCKKGFETEKKFSSHDCKNKSNSKNETYKCKLCTLTFSHKMKNNCSFCNAQFTKYKALCNHLRTEHNIKESKLYHCLSCNKQFSKKSSLNIHLKSHINNQYFCLTCSFACNNEKNFNDHMEKHKKISKHECHLCQKIFVRRQQYDQHMMAHERYVCSPCNVTFPNKKVFLKHQYTVHSVQKEKKHACPICQKLFLRPKYLEIHKRVHTGERPVKCSHCQTDFTNDVSLFKHMKTVKHLQRVSSQKGEVIKIEKPFLCSKCGVRFYHHQSLSRHVEVSHRSTEFLKCPHCDYKTKCKTNFKRHLEFHSDIKRFVCELCGSSFRAFTTLKEHYVFVHSENREFICDICKKGFKNKSTLQRHMRIHSESRPYKCFCDRAYKRMSHLKRHLISAHQMILKKNQVSLLKENTNSTMPSEHTTTFIKSLDILSDDESCDDLPVSIVSEKHATELSDLNVNEDTRVKQSPVKNKDNNNFPMTSNSMQNLDDNCTVHIIMSEESENTLNAFNLMQHLKSSSISILTNPEMSPKCLDDATLSLSPSNYCNDSPLSISPLEDATGLSHSVIAQDVLSLTSIDNVIRPHSSPNLNFQAQNVDSFASLSLPSSPASLLSSPFLNSDISSASHMPDLNLAQNSSQKQLFGESDFLLSYASNDEFETNCTTGQFYNWDTDESSSTLKVSDSDLVNTNTYGSIFPCNFLCNANNSLPNNLFANDSLDATTLNSDLESLSDLC